MPNKIKIKYINPRITEFAPNDLVVDVKNGDLYFKSNHALYKVLTEVNELFETSVGDLKSGVAPGAVTGSGLGGSKNGQFIFNNDGKSGGTDGFTFDTGSSAITVSSLISTASFSTVTEFNEKSSFTGASLNISSPITASGTISSSGDFLIGGGNRFLIESAITASAPISSSAKISSPNITAISASINVAEVAEIQGLPTSPRRLKISGSVTMSDNPNVERIFVSHSIIMQSPAGGTSATNNIIINRTDKNQLVFYNHYGLGHDYRFIFEGKGASGLSQFPGYFYTSGSGKYGLKVGATTATEALPLIDGLTVAGVISSSGTGSFGRVETTAFTATSINHPDTDGVIVVGTISSSGTGSFGRVDATEISTTRITATSITSSIVTASIIYASGSNIFGDAATDTHTFTGHITASGNISASGDVIARSGSFDIISKTGDPDTRIYFSDDDINIMVGGINMLDFTEAGSDEITFNEGAADLDVRIEGEDDANLLFTDASTPGRVGIGTNSPAAKLDVDGNINTNLHITASGDISASGTIYGNDLQIQRGATFNVNQEAAYDFKVRSQNKDHTLYVDSNKDKAGIGFNSPGWNDLSSSLHIAGDLTIDSHITASGNISASGNVIVENDITGSNLLITASGENVIKVANRGATLSKWEWHRNDVRKWVIFNDGRTSGLGGQDSLVFKHGVADDGNDHINFYMKPDDQTVYFAGDISQSGNIITEGNITASGILSMSGEGTHVIGSNLNVIGTLKSIGASNDFSGKITASKEIFTSESLEVTKHITASGTASIKGDISASGTIEGISLKIGGQNTLAFTSNTITVGGAPTKIQGNVTASGDISASGDIMTSENFIGSRMTIGTVSNIIISTTQDQYFYGSTTGLATAAWNNTTTSPETLTKQQAFDSFLLPCAMNEVSMKLNVRGAANSNPTAWMYTGSRVNGSDANITLGFAASASISESSAAVSSGTNNYNLDITGSKAFSTRAEDDVLVVYMKNEGTAGNLRFNFILYGKTAE